MSNSNHTIAAAINWRGYLSEPGQQAVGSIIECGKRWLEFYEHCRESAGKQGGSEFSARALEWFGYSHSTAACWVEIGRHSKELVDIVNNFSPDYRTLYDFIRLPAERQQRLLESDATVDRKAISNLKKSARADEINAQRLAIEAGVSEPDGLFDVVVVDPPWPYGRDYDPDGSRVANPYPEMPLEEIRALILPAKPDAVLFLWTTHQFIFDSRAILDSWGFDYKAMIVWDKERLGIGKSLRMQCEFCLVGIQGSPFWQNTTYPDIIRESRREHSRKPEAFYTMVEAITAGRRLDYFARTTRAGWGAFGNDVEKFLDSSGEGPNRRKLRAPEVGEERMGCLYAGD